MARETRSFALLRDAYPDLLQDLPADTRSRAEARALVETLQLGAGAWVPPLNCESWIVARGGALILEDDLGRSAIEVIAPGEVLTLARPSPPRSESVRILMRTDLIALAGETLELLESIPGARRRLHERSQATLLRSRRLGVAAALRSPAGSIYVSLWELGDGLGLSPDGEIVALPFTLDGTAITALAGSEYTTASQGYSDLKKLGLIRVSGGTTYLCGPTPATAKVYAEILGMLAELEAERVKARKRKRKPKRA